MKNWFEELMARNQRKSPRYLAPRLVAYFWDGAPPAAHCIRDVSLTGIYLLTVQRWYPGTVLTLTLQRTDKDETGTKKSIAVRAKVIRSMDDGVALRFVLPKDEELRHLERYIAEGAEIVDKNSLAEFLSSLLIGRSIEPI
jgi:PilZ domain